MFGFIYITTNNLDGKKYLGQSRYGKKNWETYLGSGKHLKRAVKKYGKENFTREIILECSTREELSEAEVRLITEFDCVRSKEWYNIAEGGYITRGFTGRKHSKESLRHKSEALKGRPRPAHVREALRKARENRVITAEQREQRSQRMKESHPTARSVTLNGVTYRSMLQASMETGISVSIIRDMLNNGRTDLSDTSPKPKSIVINGVLYRTLNEATKCTGLSYPVIKRLLRDSPDNEIVYPCDPRRTPVP